MPRFDSAGSAHYEGASTAGGDIDLAVPALEVRAACESILASVLFANAPRMCRLLRFLVDKAIAGDSRDTSEYAIGIEVFDRKASAYSTAEDPIVRVQIGRLREKLKAYYAKPGSAPAVEISIPIGSYMPVFRRMHSVELLAAPDGMLEFHQIKCIAYSDEAEAFVNGLYEELAHQLFKTFGRRVVRPSVPPGDGGAGSRPHEASRTGSGHLLEGSLRLDSDRIRVSMRLVDARSGMVAWSEQYDRDIAFVIALQEDFASTICRALKKFLPH